MDYEYISYTEALRINSLFNDGAFTFLGYKETCHVKRDNEMLLKHLGLTPSHGGWSGFWFSSQKKKSLLRITDQRKWLLAKIKYGI